MTSLWRDRTTYCAPAAAWHFASLGCSIPELRPLECFISERSGFVSNVLTCAGKVKSVFVFFASVNLGFDSRFYHPPPATHATACPDIAVGQTGPNRPTHPCGRRDCFPIPAPDPLRPPPSCPLFTPGLHRVPAWDPEIPSAHPEVPADVTTAKVPSASSAVFPNVPAVYPPTNRSTASRRTAKPARDHPAHAYAGGASGHCAHGGPGRHHVHGLPAPSGSGQHFGPDARGPTATARVTDAHGHSDQNSSADNPGEFGMNEGNFWRDRTLYVRNCLRGRTIYVRNCLYGPIYTS